MVSIFNTIWSSEYYNLVNIKIQEDGCGKQDLMKGG